MPTEEPSPTPTDGYVSTSMVYLDADNSVTIQASATYGDLLICMLLTVVIVLFVVRWLHAVILGGGKK